jgi:DNA-directed RNA polymerase specialized sigma24 family protein
MQNWRKYKNYKKRKNADNSVSCIIIIDGKDIEVSEEIYTEYAASSRKMEYMEFDLKRDRVLKNVDSSNTDEDKARVLLLPEREVSLEKLLEEGRDFPSPTPSPEEILLPSINSDISELRRCITLLDDDEKALIKALFSTEMTEREYAEQEGVRQQSINERKKRILRKIKNIWGKPC